MTAKIIPTSTGGFQKVFTVPIDKNDQFFIEAHSAFFEKLTAELTPLVQLQFPYSINANLVGTRNNNGAVTVVNNKAHLSTGASTNASAQMFSKTPVKYHPGQGIMGRFTALFTASTAGSVQMIGTGDSSNGYFFEDNGTGFGISLRQGGASEIRTLTVSTGSSTAENITITLDGDAKTDVAVTNTGDETLTANEIAAADYSNLGTGWVSIAEGDTVIFISFDSIATHTGTYTLSSASTAVGTFAQTVAGVAPTETFTAQTDWNQDKMDGTGDSSVTLDQTKGNVYQIQYQWLGFGAIAFGIENPNDGDFITVHTIRYANANTLPSVDNPTFPLCAAVMNTTNNTDIVLESSSMMGGVEGRLVDIGITHGTSKELAGIGTSETPILTLKNRNVYQSVINRVRVKVNRGSIGVEGTKPSTVRFKVNAVLTGASFTDFDTADSVISIDTVATALTGGDERVTTTLSKSDSEPFAFEESVILNPGDTVTISLEGSGGTTDAVGTFTWEELF